MGKVHYDDENDNISHLRAAIGSDTKYFSDGALRCIIRSHTAPGTGLLGLAKFLARRVGGETKFVDTDTFAPLQPGGGKVVDPFILNAAASCHVYRRWKAGVEEKVLGCTGLTQEEASTRNEDVKALVEGDGTVFGGHSKRYGRPVCWVTPAKHPGERYALDTVMYYYEQLFQRGGQLADAPRPWSTREESTFQSKEEEGKPGGGKRNDDLSFDIVYDRRNLSFSHARRNAAECRAYIGENSQMSQVFIDLFYCRLGDVYVLGAGGLFWGLWGLFSVFLSQEAAGKLKVLRDVKDLQHYMAEDDMPEPWKREVFS